MTAMTRRAAAPAIGCDKPDDWRESGLCRDENPELFFPLGGENGHRRSGANLLQEEDAKKVCNRCPVRVECREWALGFGEEWGVWGGLNENERRAQRPKPELSPALVAAGIKSAQVRAERSAAREKCSEGHELTEDNVYVDRTTRVCRTCRMAKQRAYRESRRAVA